MTRGPGQQSLFSGVSNQASRLRADAARLLETRCELARLEAAAAWRSVRALAATVAIALVLFLAAVPLLASSLADALDGWLGVSRGIWLLVFALALSVSAVGLAYGGWRRFRLQFSGFQQSLEELREDLDWLREKARNPLNGDESWNGED